MQKKPVKPREKPATNPPHHRQNDGIIAYREEFSGPFPHPSILKGYAELDPDVPRMILNMAEEESKHRRLMESRVIGWQVKAYFINNIFAIVAICLLLGAGCFFMLKGYAKEGAWIIIATTVSVVSVIITRTIKKGPSSKEPSME